MRNTRNTLFRTACFLWAGILSITVLMSTGCVLHREEAYRDIQRQREAAYEQWMHERENQEQLRPLLEGSLPLEDALKITLQYNKTLQAMLEERAVAEGVILESYSHALPRVTAHADYTRMDEVPGFEIEGRTITMGELNNYSAGLRVTQPLYRGGAIPAALRTAQLYALVADEKVRVTAQQVIYEVTKAYYDILLARQLLEVNRDAVESAQAHLESVNAKRRQGLATDFDVLRAQVDISLFKAEMIGQQNKLNLARSELLRIMGASQDSDVFLADELEYVPFRTIYEKELRTAYEHRPDLYLAELEIRMREEALRVARSKYLPSIDAWFGHDWARPDPLDSTQDSWGDTWRAGVTMSLVLFGGFQRKGQVHQERSRLQQRRIEMIEAEDRVMQQVRRGILSIQNAEELVDSQSMNLERALEALRLAEVGYREGITEAVAVTEARAALTRASALYYEAVYTHIMAGLSLQQATGTLGPGAGMDYADPAGWSVPGQRFREIQPDIINTNESISVEINEPVEMKGAE